MKKYDENLVVQANKIIDAKQELTLSEKKIIAMMISKVSPEDMDFKQYRIYIKDFIDIGSNRTSFYSDARKITKQILSRVLEINEDNSNFLQIGFVSHYRYFPGKAYIECAFDPDLKPYLLDLKSRFTQYQLENIMHCRSMYSIRLYEILKSFEGLGERTISLDDLKFMLNIEKGYKRFSNIKKRIIDPAQKELRQYTDIHFGYERIKEGRSIVAIKFYITKNRQIRLQFGKPDEKTIEIQTENKKLEQIKKKLSKKQTMDAKAKFVKSLNPLMTKKLKANGFDSKSISDLFDGYLIENHG